MKSRSEAKAEKAKAQAEVDAERAAIVEEGKPSKEVERLSGELNAALKPPPKFPFQWPSGQRVSEETEIREDLRRVVETVFLDDIHDTWQELEKALQLGEKRSEHAHAIRALDKGAARAQKAYRLYLTAKLARDKWEAENETIWGAMWSQATASLQKEKDDGVRSKQITDADVKARVATMFPDQYRAQEERRRAVELTVRALERLADVWLKKMGNLDSHAKMIRG